ncbi:DUF1430 domain-containing protein [Enterococcus faecalis]|uniref:DUF1430 domain-containing protein n=2 Tax=Enterococcus faecalis TaxID=1351 RepID=UPI0024561306|nr:DUF1430 domain-containing protein [Enterococcus faecalis]EJR6119505.1 DUF1430 domain-containing protein [Enterococcus faecalis]MDH5046948.1 DUF1430 domain-containing protein [Enterococcus faecalis]WIV64621.1 DUF1430 domain-containing protein [Enterococcus faecalis]
MKKIYRILLIISTVCFLYTLSTFMIETIDLVVPDTKTTVIVENWDKKRTSNKIFKEIKSYAQQNQIDIHKINFSVNNKGQTEKNIFTFSQGKTTEFYYDSQRFPTKTNFYDSSKLTNENVLGIYVLTSIPPISINQTFEELGLDVSIEQSNTIKLLFGILTDNIGILSSVLFLCTALSIFVYYITQMKKAGIYLIHGQSMWKHLLNNYFVDIVLTTIVVSLFVILYNVLWKYYLFVWLFIALFLFFILLFGHLFIQTSSTIMEKLKGKKPYHLLLNSNYILKFLLVCLFVILLFTLLNERETVKELQTSLSRWTQVDDYYTLTIGADSDLLPGKLLTPEKQKRKSQEINRRMKPFIDFLENHQAILVNNNEWLLKEGSGGSDLYLDKVPFLVVNSHFLDVVEVKGDKHQPIQKLSQDKNYLLVPENRKNELAVIQSEAKERVAFYQNKKVDSLNEITIEQLFLANNQKLFNFNSLEPEDTLSKNPIILVLSLKQLGDELDVLISEISQGHYLFKEPKLVNQEINYQGLTNEFSGIIASKDTGLEKLQKTQSQMQILSLSLIILSIVFVIVVFYTSFTYLEVNKKKLFLQYIFGKSFIERHGLYLLGMILISFIAMMMITFTNFQVIKIIPFVLFFELLFLFLIITSVEKTIRLTIIKKEN